MKKGTKLVIGSAQFGMNYGITNKKGKTQVDEIYKIMNYAVKSGINSIDTATAYGESERIIGKAQICNRFAVDTKISSIVDTDLITNIKDILDERLNKSLKKLNREQVRVLYFHDNDNKIETALHWAENQKKLGKIEEIGLSIYELNEIKKEWLDYIDTIQIPMSIYDRRAERHQELPKILKRGIKIKARSIFMQGLILENYKNWPKFIHSDLKKIHEWVCTKAKDTDKTLMEISIGYIKNLNIAEEIVVGVTSESELREINTIFKKNIELTMLEGINNTVFASKAVDPRYWNK